MDKKPLIAAPSQRMCDLAARELTLGRGQYKCVTRAVHLRGVAPDRKIYRVIDQHNRPLDRWDQNRDWREIRIELVRLFENVQLVRI